MALREVNGLLYPLDEFYAEAGLPLPAADPIEDAVIPSPYRELLVHESLMTSVLERHYGRAIRLHVLQTRACDTTYARRVVLLLDGSAQAVALGAVKLDLTSFEEAVRREILAAQRPLGHVLRDAGGAFGGSPQAFVRVTPDQLIGAALACNGTPALYGRRSTLVDGAGRPSAEIVEILAGTRPTTPSPPTRA